MSIFRLTTVAFCAIKLIFVMNVFDGAMDLLIEYDSLHILAGYLDINC